MKKGSRKNIPWYIALLVLSFLFIWFWLDHTPPGLDGKLSAIGYTVCHQIPSHSFQIGDEQFPICSRCTGMYLGVFSGVIVLLFQNKKSIQPTKKQLFIFGLLITAWIIDGINSFLANWLGRPILYQPNNIFRFLTGFGMGLCIAVTIYFLFNYAVWKNQSKQSQVEKYTFIQMAAAGLICLLLILWQNEILMKILSYISVMTIVILLITLYTVIWTILLHKENSYSNWKGLFMILNAGLLSASGQIILLDAVPASNHRQLGNTNQINKKGVI